MKKRYDAKSVREPVQVYLAEPDVAMLNLVAGHTGWTKAEVLRRGVRSIAAETLGEQGPALRFLASAERVQSSGPADAALNHDDYLARGRVASWEQEPTGKKQGAPARKRRA